MAPSKLLRVIGLVATVALASACAVDRGDEVASDSNQLVADQPVYAYGTNGYDIAVAAGGNVRVVYAPGSTTGGGSFTSQTLHLATKSANGWQDTEVVSGRSLQSPRLAMGPNGEGHIAYVAGYSLSVASESSPGVFVSSVVHDLTGNVRVEGAPAVAVDPAGNPHVAYALNRYPNHELWYAHRDSTGSWVPELVETIPIRQVRTPQIMIEGGSIHIVYESFRGTTPSEIRHAEKSATGGSWAAGLVANGSAPSLALDSNGAPHIGFYEGESLQHAFRSSSGAWGTEVVARTDYPVAVTRTRPQLTSAIAVDASGAVHVAFSDTGYRQSTLRYGRKPMGGSFELATLRAGRGVDDTFGTPNLTLAADGTAHLVYAASSTHELRYMAGQFPF